MVLFASATAAMDALCVALKSRCSLNYNKQVAVDDISTATYYS